jgi:hypothetical protein
MNQAGALVVELVGGPMDGDTIALCPQGSVGPPQQLCYLGAEKNQAAWMVYESERVFTPGWPTEDTSIKFNFCGWYSLGKQELLKS